jgi:short-subunit dehydrogenase
MAFCNQVNSIMKYLDIVVLNAGIGGYDFNVSKSGHKNIMQVNIYPNILLTLELLLLLEKSS